MKKRRFSEAAGIRLDVGCGDAKPAGWIGLDLRPLPSVDIVHDIQVFPWPVDDDSCLLVNLCHVYEHIEPKYRLRVMDELWRIIKPSGQLLLSCPYAISMGAFQDPTHYPCPNEATFEYFDPEKPLYNVYKPKPWKLVRNSWQVGGFMNVILEPRKEEKPKTSKKKASRRKR